MNTRITKLILLLFLSASIVACRKKSYTPVEDQTVLLKKIIFDDKKGDYWAFEYDAQNKLTGWTKHKNNELRSVYTVAEHNALGQPTYIKCTTPEGTLSEEARYFYNTTTGQLNKIDHLRTPARIDEFTYAADKITEKAIEKPSTTFYIRNYELDARGNILKIIHQSNGETTTFELSGYDDKKSILAQKNYAFMGLFPLSEGALPVGLVNNYTHLKISSSSGDTPTEIPFQYQYQAQGYVSKVVFPIDSKGFTLHYEYEVR